MPHYKVALLFLSFRISRFVSEKEQSSVLMGLLLPYLQRANNPQVGLLNKSVRILFIGKRCGVPSLHRCHAAVTV